MIGTFSLVVVLCNTSIWATSKSVKLVKFVNIVKYLQVFQSVVRSLHFFGMECLELPASKRSIFTKLVYFFEFSEFFPLKHYFHDVALHFLQLTFCGPLSVWPVFQFFLLILKFSVYQVLTFFDIFDCFLNFSYLFFLKSLEVFQIYFYFVDFCFNIVDVVHIY